MSNTTTKRFLGLLAGAFFSLGVLAQHTDNRTPGKFQGIQVGGAFEVEIIQGSECKVALEVYDAALLPKIRTEVRGGVLHVETKDVEKISGKMKITVTAPSYESIGLSGAAQAVSKGELKSGRMKLNCSGAAKADLALSVDNLDAQASGASHLNLKGKTGSMNVQCSGASHVKAFSFEATNGVLDASGASKVQINVKES